MKPGGDCIIDDPTTSKDSGGIQFLKEHTNSHTEPVLGIYCKDSSINTLPLDAHFRFYRLLTYEVYVFLLCVTF